MKPKYNFLVKKKVSVIVEVYLWWKLQASLIFLSGRTCTIGGWLNTFLPHCKNNLIQWKLCFTWSAGTAWSVAAAWSTESGVVSSHSFPPAPYHPPVQPAVGCWPLSQCCPSQYQQSQTKSGLSEALLDEAEAPVSRGQTWCGLWSGSEGRDYGGACAWTTRHNTRAQTCSCFCFGHCTFTFQVHTLFSPTS